MRALTFSCFAFSLFLAHPVFCLPPTPQELVKKSPSSEKKENETLYGNPSSFQGAKSIRSFLYGEPFLASIREEGVAFAIRSTGAPLQGKLIEPSSHWRPGFRIGAGIHFDHDAWEGIVDWTYFCSNFIHSIENSFITPLFIDASSYAQVPQGFFQNAKEQWTFSFNKLRFALFRPYYLSKELAIAPVIGAFAALIDQGLEISYRSNLPSASGVVAYQTDIENNAWRVGPLVGTKLDWNIKNGFWISGALQGAALYKRCTSRQRESSVGNVNGDFRILLDENTYNIQPWVDCQLGLGWGAYFNCLRNYVEVGLIYETQYFWGELFSRTLYQQVNGTQNRSLNSLGDLSMQSAALRIRLDF